MAVLGQYGKVTLSREWPEPTVLANGRLLTSSRSSIDLSNIVFQSGDRVLIVALRGVPVDATGSGYAACPTGHGFYPGGTYELGPAITARTVGGAMYGASGASPFYESAATVGFQQTFSAYIHRDSIDNVRLYETELAAVNGGDQGLIPLRDVAPGVFLILPWSDRAGYEDAAVALLQSIVDEGLEPDGGEQPAGELATIADVLTDTAADAEARGWVIQCDLTEWIFEMDAAQLDQDAIGQQFGEYARGMLRGAGSFSGEVSHRYVQGEQSGVGMLRLIFLTQQGSQATARFQLLDQRNMQGGGKVPERVMYETEILLGRTSVDTKARDIIRMTAQFVATGAIALRSESASVA